MSTTIRVVIYATALACAVTGGVLFAFSSFVLPALRALPAPEGIAAMQAINAAAPRSLLMLPLLGSALGCVVVGGYAVFARPDHGRGLLLVGAVVGLSVLAITGGYHIPRNNILAQWDPKAVASASRWPGWAAAWGRWNHLRTATAVVAAVLLAAGAGASHQASVTSTTGGAGIAGKATSSLTR